MTTRFPTVTGGSIPIYPKDGIYHTTIAVVSESGDVPEHLVGPKEVEEIQSRPSWNFHEADLRLTNERIAFYQKQVDKVATVASKARQDGARGRPAQKTVSPKRGAKKRS